MKYIPKIKGCLILRKLRLSLSYNNRLSNQRVVLKAIETYKAPTMLIWDAKDYMIGNSEARVALALNGAVLTKAGKKISVRVPIKYPRNSLVKLLPGIKVQEGLFWVLQEKGWYHTGEMTWNHTLP